MNLRPAVSESIPLSLLNDFLYCERRAALKAIEGWWGENEHTLQGDFNHTHADLPGFEKRAGWTLLRALPVWSDRLGLNGKADIVEVRNDRSDSKRDPAFVSPLTPTLGGTGSDRSAFPASKEHAHRCSRIVEARPVEYKSGRKSKWINDKVQLCAQALCLEEMLGVRIEEGLIFHAKSQQRNQVAFDDGLRESTIDAIAALQELIEAQSIPTAILKPQCDGCSLREICVPDAAKAAARVGRRLFIASD